MRLRWLIPLFIIAVLPNVFATTYYLQVINPNDYDLTNFQLKVNLTAYGISTPVAQITTLDGSNVPFCYEQPNGECNETESEIIWMKVPLIKGKDYTVVKVVVNGTNGATNGYQVFDFYDDFNDGVVSPQFAVTELNGGDVYEADGYLNLYVPATTNAAAYVLGSSVFTPPKIFEAKAAMAAVSYTYPRWGFGYYSDVKMTLFGANFLQGPSQVTLYAETYDGTALGLTAIGPGDDQFHYWKIIWMSSKVDYFEDGSLVATRTDYIPQQTVVALGVTTHDTSAPPSASTSRIDWVRVRKYADQDPIVRYSYQGSFSEGTPSQTSTEYNQTYLYVRQVTVLPENSVSVSNAQVILELDTASLISEGKLQSDCSDIYVTYYDPLYGELPAKFWVDPTTCNTKATRIYVKLPIISVNNDWIINVYYGSPGAIPMWDPKNTFTFYVDLTNPSDISQNLIIRTEGTTTLDYTSSGLVIQTGSDGKVLIVNK